VTNAAAAPDDIESVEKRIVTWDGKELATRIYLPETDEPAPAVLITHGYGSDKNSRIPAEVGRLYADNGYVVLTYDSRGFGESDGEVGVDGPKEVKDAQALLDWLEDARQFDVGRDGAGRLVERELPPEAENGNSEKDKRKGKKKGQGKAKGKDKGNGKPEPSIKVGMDGLSYAGGIQLNLAAVDDRLDAIVPRWAWNDLTYSLAPNGGLKAGWTTILQEFGFEGSRGVNSGDGQPDERDVRNGVDPRLYKFYAESAATNEFSPSARAFFKLRSPSTKAEGLAENAPPSLLISGWNDTLFTGTETVRNHDLLSASADSRMVFIRGGHSLEQQAPLEQGEVDRMALTWMHRHVGGQAPDSLPKAWEPAAGDERTADIPEVTYWRQDLEDDVGGSSAGGDGIETAFDTADGLPDASAGPSRTLAEAANAGSGTTDLAGGPAGGSNSEIAVQENDDYAPGTFADFDYPVDGETELLGVPEVSLSVTPLGRDPLVFAKVYHVRADGSEELIYNQSTPYEVEGPVGESQEITFDLAAIERTFEAGDTLRVTLSTTDVAYFNSRSSAGVRIDNGASEVRLPVDGGSGLAAPADGAIDGSDLAGSFPGTL
jgi:ABC-2 type transport system ATP-binding protein